MFKYSKNSFLNKESCHPDLQAILDILITFYDHSVVFGYRGEKDQNIRYERGDSQLKYPHSKHNKKPAMAVDIIPYPGGYKAPREQFIIMGCLFIGIAKGLKAAGIISHDIRWGADWKGGFKVKDWDFGHLELI
jgi:peptidoglycan L-alanyl-D-glutamate endopeptidase CwlK